MSSTLPAAPAGQDERFFDIRSDWPQTEASPAHSFQPLLFSMLTLLIAGCSRLQLTARDARSLLDPQLALDRASLCDAFSRGLLGPSGPAL